MAISHNEIVYKGYVGKLEQKEGDGEESYRGQQGYENYLGPFKRDAYNGRSNYFANSIKRGLWAYSGDFHSNSIEGYGAMSYGDATYFAGLFKYDKPFGPGVLTYTNGRQDVGIWCGSQIYRLCTTVGSIEKLTNSPQDRLQVTKFKKLIAINEPPRDIASTLLKALRSSEDQYIDPSVLYSRFCKDPRSYFYDHNYFNDDLSDLQEIEKALSEKDKSEAKLTPDTYTPATKFVNTGIVEVDRDVHKSEEEEEEEEEDFYETQQTSKKTLKENADQVFVLTWNNTPKVINIMKHSFKYRQLEESETFDIGNILCGRRKLFRTRGPKEIASIKILEASASNDVITILKQLKRHTLNVDVMDNKGNSMILRAAAHDALDVMQMLHILGADIDAVNDEGFSALTHTLTRYIALTYDVNNWSQGFLARSQSEEDEDQEDNWLDYCMQSNFSLNPGSAVSFGQRSGSKMKKRPRSDSKASLRFPRKVSIADEPSTEYVFDLGPEPPCTKLKKLNLSSDAESEKNQKLEVIMGTAFYLLDIGADIHVSVTPAPIMVLAIFSGNVQIVEKLLRCGADANELHSLNNGFLTALHIIAQARPLPAYPAMVNLFLRYGADPNHRTSENYNMSEWEYLLDHVKLPHSLAPGLTPLQIIAMRSDATYVTNKEYLEQICCLLSWFSNHNEHFLGLSPLGLAISKGNSNIVSTMLNCAKINVNETFDSFWGNPLFTYLRCHGYKDEPTTLNILRTLILKGADPLETSNCLHGEGNALNFIRQLRNSKLVIDKRTLSRYAIYGDSRKDVNLRIHEHLLMELAKLNLRKYIRGVLIRLHLKYINSMDAERDFFLRQMHLLAKHRSKSAFGSVINCDDDDNCSEGYGYKEICERTTEWMNSIDECRDIMEKTIESMGDMYSPVQAIKLISLLPNMAIKPKKPELKNLRIIKFLDGKCLPDLRTCPITKKPQFPFETQDDENEGDEENLKWIRHFVTLHLADNYVYPEMEKNRSKYVVCYKCLRQTPTAQACPICRLVYFCSMKCNLADSNKPDGYHCCAVIFWNLKENQFFALRKEESPKKSPKSFSKKGDSISSKSRVFETFSEFPLGLDLEAQEQLAKQAKEKKKKLSRQEKRGKRKRGKDKDKKKHDKIISKGKKRKGSMFSIKHPSRRRSRKESRNLFGLVERDPKMEERDLRTNVDVAARLLDKQSHLLEQVKLDAERLKEELDQVDVSLLGEVAPPEQFWATDDEKGEREKSYSTKTRFLAFLKMLEWKYDTLNLEEFLPFIVFVDGVMYFKYYGTPTKYRENYSFN